MIGLNLRIRRGFILIWSLSLWAFLAIFPPAYESYYPEPASRDAFLAGMQANSGMTSIYGPLVAPATLGQIVAWEAGSMVLLLGGVMAVLLVSGLHRKSEHSGYTELQLSTGISRLSPAAAATFTTALTALTVGAGSTLVLAFSGLYVDEMPVEGAVAFGVTVALSMTGSALLAQLALLLVSNPNSVGRAALLTVAGSFIVRAVADAEEIGWLNWLSPLGWKSLIGAYVDDDFRTAGLLSLLCAMAAGLILLAERLRDYDRGLFILPTRTHPRSRNFHGPVHLAAILHRTTVITWALVIAGISGFFFALTGSLSGWLEADESVGRVFDQVFASSDMKSEFIAYVAKLSGILVATAGVQTVVAHHAGEKDRTVDLLRSTGIGRWVPLGSVSLVAVVGVLLSTVAVLVGGLVGLSTQDSTTSADYEHLVPASWSQLAPALLLTGIAVAIVGIAPRLTQFSWAPIVGATILTLFGPLLQAPQWLIDLSPFEYVVTAEGGDWAVHGLMGALSAALVLAGLHGSQRREIR